MRPEVLTDKQILKRLNKEFTKSVIFNQVKTITKLPEQIKRDRVEEVTTKKKPNKKAPLKKGDKGHNLKGQEEESASSEDFHDAYDPDFFIDRDMNCLEEVKKAKNEAVSKAKDNVEWSG